MKVAPPLGLTNSHTIGGEGIAPIIIYNTTWHTLKIQIWEYNIQFIFKLLVVVDDKLNHIGWADPQIINPEI